MTSVIYVAIAACEIAFWLFLAGGLVARYLFKSKRVSTVLLLGSPAADLMLLLLVAIDVQGGATPEQAHALAATFLGFSVAFGPGVVRWADGRLARRFSDRKVEQVIGNASEQVQDEWRLFARAALAWAIASTALLGMAALVGDLERARPLLSYIAVLTMILVIWFFTGPVYTTARLSNARLARFDRLREVNALVARVSSGRRLKDGS